MCGIIGYIGKQNSLPILISGLKKLEYRGYDSAGIAVFNKNLRKINVFKTIGAIDNLKLNTNIEGNFGIGHTRWATHGKVSVPNAHPHFDCQKNIFVVHNGIIENYAEIKKWLQMLGHKFHSETDTEIVAHLIEEFQTKEKLTLEEAARKTFKLLSGTYALAIISRKEPFKIIVAKNSSPLLLGIGKDEFFVASDATALISYTKNIVYLGDKEFGILTPENYRVATIDAVPVAKTEYKINWQVKDSSKRKFKHYMLKEILETPNTIENAIRGRIVLKDGIVKFGGLEQLNKKIKNIRNIIVVGCGTAYYAGLIGKYLLEELSDIEVEVEQSSEFRYRKFVYGKKTAVLAISQSGETADTLAAIKEAKRKGLLTLAIVNVVGSSIAREVNAGIYNHAGPEISVASTKNFISQLVILTLLSIFLGRQRKLTRNQAIEILKELTNLPKKINLLFNQIINIKKIAKKYYQYPNFIFIGRKYNYPIALEGALKLKEVSYIHAEGFGGGELKHGPLALIDEKMPVIAIAPKNDVYSKMISNIEELKSRGAKIIGVITDKTSYQKLFNDFILIPKTLPVLEPILTVIPLQLFAYFCAVFKKLNPDKPRNLAKSVTVE